MATGSAPIPTSERLMALDRSLLVGAMVVGIGATLAMDLWNLFLKRAFGIPSLNYCLLGRWVRHMPRTWRHASIAAAAPKPHECTVGWIVHYTIGVTLGVGLVVRFGAATRQPVPWVSFGTGLVLVCWVITSIGFGLYATYVASYTSVFGHLASVFVLLLYLWLSANSFLVGIQVDAEVRERA